MFIVVNKSIQTTTLFLCLPTLRRTLTRNLLHHAFLAEHHNEFHNQLAMEQIANHILFITKTKFPIDPSPVTLEKKLTDYCTLKKIYLLNFVFPLLKSQWSASSHSQQQTVIDSQEVTGFPFGAN